MGSEENTKVSSMENFPADYIIIGRKAEAKRVEALSTPLYEVVDRMLEQLLTTVKGKLVINPIYRVVKTSKKGACLRRRRECVAWELECLSMLKAMPHEIFISSTILNDMQISRLSPPVISLLKRGVIIEVPQNFI